MSCRLMLIPGVERSVTAHESAGELTYLVIVRRHLRLRLSASSQPARIQLEQVVAIVRNGKRV